MGATRSWHIETPVPHAVRVQYALHSGRVLLYIDGCLSFERRGGNANWDEPFEYEFVVENIPCKLLVTGIDCHLWMDGRLQI